MSRAETLARFPVLAGRHVIVFDGDCVLCSGFFRFVVTRDTRRLYSFAIAQSSFGEALYAHFGLKPADYDTNLVLRDGCLTTRLDAFAAVMSDLGWPWRALSVVRWLPRPIADRLYERIARNRYRLFGRRDICLVPGPDVRARFIDDPTNTAPATARG